MAKTRLLRKVVMGKLQTVPGETYHRQARKDAAYPYKVFTLTDVSFTDVRDDLYIEIDIWDRSLDPKTAEDIADQIEALFHNANIPTPPIYPTFFRDARYTLDDPDKNLQHIQLRFLVQLYELEE